MKTIDDIKQELREIPYTKVEGDEIEIKKFKKVFNKNNTRAIFLKQCIMYLEKDPSQDFITAEIARLRNKLSLINLGYAGWLMPDNCKTPKTQYESEAGVPLIKQQIKTLSFLLS